MYFTSKFKRTLVVFLQNPGSWVFSQGESFFLKYMNWGSQYGDGQDKIKISTFNVVVSSVIVSFLWPFHVEMIPTSFYQLVFVLRSISEKQKNLKQNNNPCHALHSISPYIAITPLNCFSCSVLPVMYLILHSLIALLFKCCSSFRFLSVNKSIGASIVFIKCISWRKT